MSPVAAIMLSGGRSRRMGQDKAQLRFVARGNTWTMQSWMAERWSQHCDPLVWVGAQETLESQGRASSGRSATLYVQDLPEYAGEGPLAGLYSGLFALQASRGPQWALLLGVDMPGFEPHWLPDLCAQTDASCDAIRYRSQGRGSLLGALLSVSKTAELAHLLLQKGERRLSALDQALSPRLLEAPADAADEALRSSMNAPADFERWLGRMGFHPLGF